MAGYRIYLLADEKRIDARFEIEEPSDETAIEAARAIFRRETTYRGFEVWLRARMVHRELR